MGGPLQGGNRRRSTLILAESAFMWAVRKAVWATQLLDLWGSNWTDLRRSVAVHRELDANPEDDS
jgi:hypothetical protein